MSIFIDQQTRLVVQGITGRDGSFHARQMIAYGTTVVAGVTPGKGGQRFDDTVPVFDTVAEAVRETQANTAVIHVPAAGGPPALFEAPRAGVPPPDPLPHGGPGPAMTPPLPLPPHRGARPLRP